MHGNVPPHSQDSRGAAATDVAPRRGSSGEIRALTGLRIVAALWVVAFHMQGAFGWTLRPVLEPVWPVLQAGWLGVDLFFVLSGFVMVLTYLETMGPRFTVRSAVLFLWARICRVWPLWALLTCTYGVFLTVTGYDAGRPAYQQRTGGIGHLVDQLAMVQMWHRAALWGASYIEPGWSLSAEFAAYAAFPLTVLLLWRLRRLPSWVLGGLAVLAMVPMAHHIWTTGLLDWRYSWIPRIAGAFLSGGLVCMCVQRLRRTEDTARIAARVAALAVVQVVLICIWASWVQQQTGRVYFGLSILVFPVLVGALALSSTGVARLLSTDTMVLGGRISFALYLVHTPVLEGSDWLSRHVGALHPGSATYVALQPELPLIALGLAYVLWRCVEEPARKYLRHRGPGRLAVAPASAAAGVPTAHDLASTGRVDPDARPAVAPPAFVATTVRPGAVPGRTHPHPPARVHHGERPLPGPRSASGRHARPVADPALDR